MGLNAGGRDWSLVVNWDSLGKSYASLIIVWTLLLLSGIIWLIAHRNVTYIRMRNLPLAIASTCFLHVYLVKIFLAYTTNGHFPCGAEFWIMSIYLPFGISLFQANTLQLRSISERQGQLLSRQSSGSSSAALLRRRKSGRSWESYRMRWNELSELQVGYICIGVGMGIQFLVTGVLYGTSPTLQGDWSSYGNLPFSKGQALCRHSYQWIPSAFWQLFWSWFYGPYMLFQIRSIHEVHHWRLQTFLSVLAGLPGTPLWLAAVYSPAFAPVNKWFVPPMWLAPGIIVMQACAILFPIYEAIEFHATTRRPLHTLFSSESMRTASSGDGEKVKDKDWFADPNVNSFPSDKNVYSMDALEKALTVNPSPLLYFAAKQDFTAENIIFLIHVMRWRDAWRTAPRERSTGLVTEHARAQLFRMAVEVYMANIYEQTAIFPINIEGAIRRSLDNTFGPAVPGGKRLDSNMWDNVSAENVAYGAPPPMDVDQAIGKTNWSPWDDEKVSPIFPEELQEADNFFAPNPCVAPLGPARARIPQSFHQGVFDKAEESIKILVLTNTWCRFVRFRSTVGELDAMG